MKILKPTEEIIFTNFETVKQQNNIYAYLPTQKQKTYKALIAPSSTEEDTQTTESYYDCIFLQNIIGEIKYYDTCIIRNKIGEVIGEPKQWTSAITGKVKGCIIRVRIIENSEVNNCLKSR